MKLVLAGLALLLPAAAAPAGEVASDPVSFARQGVYVAAGGS